MRILIVGASGNLGSHIARSLLTTAHELRLLVHKTPLPHDLAMHPKVRVCSGDLADIHSLPAATEGVERIVYAAGALFRPHPAKFLPITNTVYVRNIVDAAVAARASRFILISFPHVEENTTPESPAQGRLDARPKSIHGRTRLQAEKCLFDACRNRSLEPVVLRAGVIYGPNIRLIQAARRLMESRLCAVWRKPTWVHLLALPDFLRCVEIAINRDGVRGIYNICDDCPVLLQEFMDDLAAHWGFRKPRRLPAFCFSWAAGACELLASVLHTGTPLTRDMIRMGMTSVVADTSRMKQDLRCELQFPSFREGLSILGGVCR